jgi:translocation and assembly module TamB
VQLNGEALNPALFDANFPGRLSLALTSEGQIHAGIPNAKVDLHQLEGVLLDRPLQARGEINLDGKTVSFSPLELISGANRAQLNGSMGDSLSLKWSVDAPQLDTLWPWLSGALYGTGEVSGPSATPRIQADIQGEQIAYRNNRVEAFHNRVDLDLGDSQKMDLTLRAENLQAGGMHWDSLDMSTTGVIDRHHIDLALQGKEVPKAWLVMDAGLSQEDYLWSGRLQQLTLDTLDLGSWQLAGPAAFALSMETQTFERICLHAADSRLCGAFNAEIGQGWQAALQAANLPLTYLQRWLPAETRITGMGNLEADFTADTRGTIQGSADLSLPAGKLNFELEGEPQVVDFSGGLVKAVIDQQGGRAKLTLPLGSLGGIEGEASLPGLQLPTIKLDQQALEGRLKAHIEDLGLISVVAPNLQNVRGRIQADFSLAGRLDKPSLQGKAELQDGAVDIPEAGIELRTITLRAQASDLDRLTLEGLVESGKGVLNLNGETLLQPERGFPSKLRIQGKDWVALNIPEAEVHVSPDFSIEHSRERTDLAGEIHIPYARIRLRKLPESVKKSSSDLVIVGGDSPSEQPTDPRFHTTLRIILGDRVSFDGLGLRAKLTGNLQVIDEPGRPVMGRGRIGVTEGTYRAYGQDLKIERGYALFADSPVDNPGLDVQAVREAGEVTAGVRVTGTLKSPKLSLFSTPTMNKTEVISYLLTGRAPGESGGSISLSAAMMASGAGSITEEIGRQLGLEELRLETESTLSEASVVAGTYLSPRLYVQFVNDLVSRETIMRLRYDLTDRLQIQTESGRYQGADIFYIIER